MHTVAMRTEATMPEEEPPANLGRAFKVVPLVFFSHSRESWMVMYLAWNIDCDYVYEQETFILAYPSLAWQLSACNHGEVLIWYSLSDLFTWGGGPDTYERDVCISCYPDVQHIGNVYSGVHTNWLHGSSTKPLPTRWNHICIHKWVRFTFSCTWNALLMKRKYRHQLDYSCNTLFSYDFSM